MAPKSININHMSFPSILLGTEIARLEGTGRLAIPVIWREHFSHGKACLITSRLGSLPCKMLFPYGNVIEILRSTQDLRDREAIARSSKMVPIDRQGRLMVAAEKEDFPRDVTLLGSLSHIKIVETALADD